MYYVARPKKVWNLVFGPSYLGCQLIISIESGVNGKLVHFTFRRCPICKDRAPVG